jgi:hypothetical protein
MNNFIPEQPKIVSEVPYFDDVTSDAGWQGYSTTKSMETLKSEIVQAVSRLGGIVNGFQKGKFLIGDQHREGFRVFYTIESGNGQMIPGRIDIAALPVKRSNSYRKHSSYEKRLESSLKMALYMLRNSFDGLWFLQQLSPGFAPLMPFMLTKNDLTVSQLWSESSIMNNLLPPADSDFVDGEVIG